MIKKLLGMTALAMLPLLVLADTAYVTDKLRLGLHQAADTSDRAFRTLDSGQQVEVLSRNGSYAQVSLPDGTRGYVKAAYLVEEKPATLIVAETQAQVQRLQGELDTLRSQFAAPEATISALQQEADSLQAQAEMSGAEIAELRAKNETLRNRQAQFKHSLPLVWVAGATGVCLVAGFLLALWWVDRRSRARHGGVRIY